MGAYENPEIAIDTQSGQYIRNMIGNVANTAVNVIKEFKLKEEEHNKKISEFSKNTLTSTNKDVANIAKDSSFDISKLTTSFKDVLSGYSADAVSNDLTKSKTALDALQTKQAQGKKTLQNTIVEVPVYLEGIKKAVQKQPFTPGALYSETPEDMKQFAFGLAYNKTSKAEVNFAKDKDGNIDLGEAYIDYTIELQGNDTPIKRPMYLSSIMNNNKVHPDGPYTIPSMKDDDFMKSLPNIFNVDEKGKIGAGLSDIILKNPKYMKAGTAPMGQSAKGDKSNKTVSAGYYVTDIADRDGIASDPEVMSVAVSAIDGMINSNPRGLAMLANDVWRRQFPDAFEKIKDIDDVAAISSIKDKLAKAYAKSIVYKQLPDPQIIRKDAAGQPVYVKNVQEKAEDGGDQNEPTKLTAAQKRDISYVQDRWKKVKNGHDEYPLNEAGTIIYKENVLYKAVKDPTIPNSPAKLVPLPDSLKKYYGLPK